MSLERTCFVSGCGNKFSECDGFVLARDIKPFLEGRRDGMSEMCGRDALLMSVAVDFYGADKGQYLNYLLKD